MTEIDTNSPVGEPRLRKFVEEVDFRFVFSVVLFYAVVVSLGYWAIDSYVAGARKPQFHSQYLSTLAPAFLQMTVALGLFVLVAALLAGAASPPDRRLLFRAAHVSSAPIIFCLAAIWMLRLGFWAISSLTYYLLWGGIFVLVALYYQVVTPIVRTWLHRKAEDQERIAAMEAYFTWPFRPDEWREIEIVVPPEKYLGLLGGFGAFLFLVLETVLGEFLSDTLAVTGYVGAIGLAVVVAAILYPAHSWASKRITIAEPATDDQKGRSSLREIGGRFLRFHKHLFVRHWRVALIIPVAGWVLGKMLTAFIWPY